MEEGLHAWLAEGKGRWIRGKKVTLKWSKILSVVGGAKGKVDTIKILGA